MGLALVSDLVVVEWERLDRVEMEDWLELNLVGARLTSLEAVLWDI